MPARILPVNFDFEEVTGVQTAINELETIHRMLPAQPLHTYALHNGEIDTAQALPASLMLLGIMSGNEARRDMLKCSWKRVPRIISQIRVRFVVGIPATNPPLSSEWEEHADELELRVNVSEGQRLWRFANPQRHQSYTGTFSTYIKQVSFLRFAASQQEPLIGRADDDAFISPHALLAYATILHRYSRPLYAGVFEWISWRAARLEATGFSYGLAEARGRAKAPHRNCSRIAPPARSAAYEHVCIGPFGYAKGPLLVMNSLALQWLIHAPVFRRDVSRAAGMAQGLVATRKGRLDDDINLGFWMARMPSLDVIRLRRVVWKDTWRDGADVRKILAAHKLPWSLHDELFHATSAAWRLARQARVDAFCRTGVPPCRSCAHSTTQRPCILEVALELRANKDGTIDGVNQSKCIFDPKHASRCPKFGRESHPKPSHTEARRQGVCVGPAQVSK